MSRAVSLSMLGPPLPRETLEELLEQRNFCSLLPRRKAIVMLVLSVSPRVDGLIFAFLQFAVAELETQEFA